jgi:adenylylsulfate kinase
MRLNKHQINTYSLDGDNLRCGLNKDLSFSKNDRDKNLRRVAEVSKLFVDAGIVVIAAFISPYIKKREDIKNIVGSEDYIEVFVNTPLEICEQRDVKSLYKKARAGEIKNFTGIDSPYENPINPSIEINTIKGTPEEAVDKIILFIKNRLSL